MGRDWHLNFERVQDARGIRLENAVGACSSALKSLTSYCDGQREKRNG